jgi:hypothetical protein
MELVDDPETRVLDDGQEWVVPRALEHLDPFLGKIVAVRPPTKKKIDQRPYQIHPGPTFYAIVSETDRISFRGKMDILKYIVKQEYSDRTMYQGLIPKDLRTKDFPMRLLTVDEACHLATAVKEGGLSYWCWDFLKWPSAPINSNFKLSDLTPKERRRYVREHGHEHEELKYIQTLCGLREKRQTALNQFPKDIVKIVLRKVVDSEIARNGDLLLNVHKLTPKKSWCSECVVQ